MATLRLIRLTAMSPLHIGIGRDTYDVAAPALHSDTLSAALAAIRAVQGKVDDLQQFLDSFALSSAFPYAVKGDKTTLFMPKPAGKLNVAVKGLEEKDYRKSLKKVKFIALPIWRQLVAGDALQVEQDQLHGAYLLDKADSEFTPPMKSVVSHRVAVPREDNKDAEPFAFEWTFFKDDEHEKSGLFCLLHADSDEVADEVTELFSELGEQGIGSDRNVGGGHFNIATEQFEFVNCAGANATMLLSSYIPTEEELTMLDVINSRYQLIKRGGFISGSNDDQWRHLRKNTIYMFTAGSTFNTLQPLKGKVVDLRPAWNDNLHHVWRSGKPLAINIKTTDL